MMAARGWGKTEVVSLLLKAGANTDLNDKVSTLYTEMYGSNSSWIQIVQVQCSVHMFMYVCYCCTYVLQACWLIEINSEECSVMAYCCLMSFYVKSSVSHNTCLSSHSMGTLP